MAQWRKVVVSGSNAVLNEVTASGAIVPKTDDTVDLGSSTLEFKDLYIDGTAYLDSATITAGTITGITDLVVADGGTGVSTLTDGGILLGSGTGAITATAVLADGEILIGDGTTDPVALDVGGNGGITILGTIATGVWEGTAVADTYVANDLTISGGTVNNSVIGGSTAAAATVTTLINASTVAASRITGSFTGSFVGDGSNLTGVAQDIELLSAYGAGTLHQTEDKFLVSDNGTEKSITFSNLEDSIFANVSSDIEIAAGGVATIGNDKIDSQHYVAASIDNEHLANNAVDSDELAAGSVDDGHLSDGVATGLAGAGMTATSGVMNVIGTGGAVSVSANAVTLVAANTTLTSIINASLTKIGTSTSQEYITFGTSNEVNTFVNNTERHSVTATGVDVTGNLTISGDLDVNGTTTTIDTANLTIADKFAIFASGSTSATDGGIIVQGGVTSGYALGYDAGVGRWAFDADLAHDATDLGPDAYVGVVQFGTATPDTQTPTPTYGGVTNGIGTIYVDTDDSEIWIYA
jgi:hypothetical protein